MSRSRTSRDDAAPITADDLARLRRNGPAALARRGPAHVGQTLASALQLALLGGVPLAGLTWYDWSAAHLLAYNVVGAWIGILADWARVAYAGDAVRRDAQTHYDDWHVWVVAGALRAGRTTAPRSHLRARHDPWGGVLVDLAGGAMTAGMVGVLLGRSGALNELRGDRTLVLSLAGLAAYQAVLAAIDIVRSRRHAAAAPVDARPGVRGVGLFLLAFLVGTIGDADSAGAFNLRLIMLTVNGAIVLAAVATALSPLWLRSETAWLRNYLHEHRRPHPVDRPTDHRA